MVKRFIRPPEHRIGCFIIKYEILKDKVVYSVHGKLHNEMPLCDDIRETVIERVKYEIQDN